MNYDLVLLHLARLINAPYAKRISDRLIPRDNQYQRGRGLFAGQQRA
ncbi:MAG: hypothetical protein ACOCX3_01795 [Chloroflexota bacterium]